MVLLKNEKVHGSQILPLTPSDVSSIALIGRLADLPNTGDHGSSDVRSPEVITALTGIREAFPNTSLQTVLDDDPKAAALAAAESEIAVIVVGYTGDDEGEYVGGDVDNNPLYALWSPNSSRFGVLYGTDTKERFAALRDAFIASPDWTVAFTEDGTYVFRYVG